MSIIDCIRYDKQSIPAPNKYKVNYQSVDPKERNFVYRKEKKERFPKFEKKNDPSPFTYKTEESFTKTQLTT